MEQINESDKKRLVDYIDQNELDYHVVDNNISKFSLTAADGITFYIYPNNENYVLVKYDKIYKLTFTLNSKTFLKS